jgi:tRNA G18 (ribose-2'-O)-methylase SpoU
MELQEKTMEELNRKDIDSFKSMDKFPLVIILDQVRSGLNVGSVFRTADAFALQSVACVGYTPTPPHREVLKTALGSCDSVHWQHFSTVTEAITFWKNQGYSIWALEQTQGSVPMEAMSFKGPTAIVLGNEVTGVSDEALQLCDGCWEITQYGTKHSLNVSVSAGMAIYQWVTVFQNAR